MSCLMELSHYLGYLPKVSLAAIAIRGLQRFLATDTCEMSWTRQVVPPLDFKGPQNSDRSLRAHSPGSA